MWLSLQHCLKTWDNSMKRGWYGPSVCSLHKMVEETVKHLFIKCRFTVEVWKILCLALKIPRYWEGENFD